jgi:polyhydroxyalkanoate synthesis regulator phasin
MASARRRNSVTKFLQDIIDDSKELVDDMIDRAEDAEEHARDAVSDVVDDDDDTPSKDELESLRAALADLTGKIDQLANAKTAKK